MISLLMTILVISLIFGLVWYILNALALPAPFGRVAQVACVVIFCIWLIYLLLPYATHPLLR